MIDKARTVTGRNLLEMFEDGKRKFLEPFRHGWGHESLRGCDAPSAYIVQILQFRLDNARSKFNTEPTK